MKRKFEQNFVHEENLAKIDMERYIKSQKKQE